MNIFMKKFKIRNSRFNGSHITIKYKFKKLIEINVKVSLNKFLLNKGILKLGKRLFSVVFPNERILIMRLHELFFITIFGIGFHFFVYELLGTENHFLPQSN